MLKITWNIKVTENDEPVTEWGDSINCTDEAMCEPLVKQAFRLLKFQISETIDQKICPLVVFEVVEPEEPEEPEEPIYQNSKPLA